MKASSIIGHRGACGHAPENTLASVRKAAELGVQWVEFDTMLSADDEVVIIHDESLKRTTGLDALVAQTNWHDMHKLDAGGWYSQTFAGEGIPLFRDVIKLLDTLKLNAVIEIKPSTGRDEETSRLSAQIVKDYWPETLPSPIFSSFNENALKAARNHAPDIPRALNVSGSLDSWQERLQMLDCVAIHCNHKLLDEAGCAAIIEAGYDLRCFTVNELQRGQTLIDWGATAIFTDYPDRFL